MYMSEVVRSGSRVLFFLLVVLSLIPFARLHAADILDEDLDVFTYTGEGEAWKEQAVTIPVYPEKENLLPVNILSGQFKYFLDSTSISIGSDDEVIRYSVVAVSKSGVRNVFYEGIRCDVKEYKTYAYGSGAGPFRKMSSGWKRVRGFGSQGYRSDLVGEYFCKGEAVPEKIENIIQELKDSF